jgi:hypothetical protein
MYRFLPHVARNLLLTLYQPYVVYRLTLYSRALLEKLIVAQLAKKFPAFYGTRMFITVFIGE